MRLFKRLDDDASGELSIEELGRVVGECGLKWPDEDVTDLFKVRIRGYSPLHPRQK